MPTLPLFDWPVAPAGASHRVRAPGGYEVWRFAAHDPSTQTWIEVRFYQGLPCQQYIRRYMRYRRWPTRFAPPLPAEYPAVSISIYSRGGFTTSAFRFRPTEFAVSAESGVQIGPHGFAREEDGAIHLRAPHTDLRFRPPFSPNPSEHLLTPKHRWILTDALCDVSGTLEISQARIALSGKGFHDQQFGTEPMLRNSFCGCLFLKDTALAFQKTQMMHIATFSADSLSPASETWTKSPPARTIWGLSYPRTINFSDGPVLDCPRIVHSRPTIAHLLYEARWNGEKGRALCEIGAPGRLGWSILW